jgi:hypothetical protein
VSPLALMVSRDVRPTRTGRAVRRRLSISWLTLSRFDLLVRAGAVRSWLVVTYGFALAVEGKTDVTAASGELRGRPRPALRRGARSSYSVEPPPIQRKERRASTHNSPFAAAAVAGTA